MTPEQGSFCYARFLGLVTFALPGGWTWIPTALDEPGCVGGIVRCYAPGGVHELGYVLAADVSQDPDEPNVSSLDKNSALAWDRFAERAATDIMPRQGRRLVKWMSSSLNESGTWKEMTTAYIASDCGRDRQCIDTRFRISEYNIVIGGCFDVAQADKLATLIFGIMRGARIGPDPSFERPDQA